jgi:hypothetical protein
MLKISATLRTIIVHMYLFLTERARIEWEDALQTASRITQLSRGRLFVTGTPAGCLFVPFTIRKAATDRWTKSSTGGPTQGG